MPNPLLPEGNIPKVYIMYSERLRNIARYKTVRVKNPKQVLEQMARGDMAINDILCINGIKAYLQITSVDFGGARITNTVTIHCKKVHGISP